MRALLATELQALVLLLVLSIVPAATLQRWWIAPVLALLVLLLWYWWQLAQVWRWLEGEDHTALPPDAAGLPGRIVDKIYAQRRLQRQRYSRVQSEAAYLEEALAALSEAVVMLNRAGAIDWCNAAAKPLLGLRFPDDRGQLLQNLVRGPVMFKFLADTSESASCELRHPLQPSRTLLIEATWFGQGNRLLFVRDITDVRRLEQVRTDFMANASHELRTPLTVIRGYLENFSALLPDATPAVQRMVTQMQAQTGRMTNLVEDLMLLSRLEHVPESSQAQWVDVASLVRRVAADVVAIDPDADKHLDLVLAEQLLLHGSEQEIHSAISNLLVNAWKYTPAGGHIQVSWQATAVGARLAVSDTGIGIEAMHIPRLTERFYRVDPSRSKATGGTGLGLAIVKHVLARHGSQLEVRSKPGQGSEFACSFGGGRVKNGAAITE